MILCFVFRNLTNALALELEGSRILQSNPAIENSPKPDSSTSNLHSLFSLSCHSSSSSQLLNNYILKGLTIHISAI